MKIRKFIVLFLLLTNGLINAQKNFRSGYIITNNRDTLFGEIDYRGDLLMGETCRFRINETENERTYSPYDIVAYRFIDDKYFISKEVFGRKSFLEFLIEGQINIYYIRISDGEHYFLEKEGRELTEIPYKEEITNIGGKQYLINSTKHIGILNDFMRDAPEFQPRIAEMGKPDHKRLIKLAEDYHNKVCLDKSCIVYEKALPLIRLNIEVFGGVVSYKHMDFEFFMNKEYSEHFKAKNYFQTGILTLIWMPRSNQNLFLKTGLIYSTLESNFRKISFYKLPIQIEYLYPKGIVRPKLAVGINLHKPFFHSYSFMGGLNIRIKKNISVVLDYDFDFIRVDRDDPILSNKSVMISQSFSTGLEIKFKEQ